MTHSIETGQDRIHLLEKCPIQWDRINPIKSPKATDPDDSSQASIPYSRHPADSTTEVSHLTVKHCRPSQGTKRQRLYRKRSSSTHCSQSYRIAVFAPNAEGYTKASRVVRLSNDVAKGGWEGMNTNTIKLMFGATYISRSTSPPAYPGKIRSGANNGLPRGKAVLHLLWGQHVRVGVRFPGKHVKKLSVQLLELPESSEYGPLLPRCPIRYLLP